LLQFVSATGSTNSDLSDRLRSGDPVAEGFWLIADRQSAGRGRLGRLWSDGAGNFMGSTVVYPQPRDPHAGSLALVVGLAVQAAVTPRLPAPHVALLKWPNDLMVGAAKLAGILLERVGDGVVVGVGVNLSQAPEVPGRETVSLAAFGPAPDRDLFATDLAGALTEELGRWRQFGLAALLARWQAGAHRPGTALTATLADGTRLSGRFDGLDEVGALRLRLPCGTTQLIHAGDITLA